MALSSCFLPPSVSRPYSGRHTCCKAAPANRFQRELKAYEEAQAAKAAAIQQREDEKRERNRKKKQSLRKKPRGALVGKVVKTGSTPKGPKGDDEFWWIYLGNVSRRGRQRSVPWLASYWPKGMWKANLPCAVGARVTTWRSMRLGHCLRRSCPFSSLLFSSLLVSSLLFSSLLLTSLHFSSFLFSSLLVSSLLFSSRLFSSLLFSSILFTSLLLTSLHFSSLLFSSLLFCSLHCGHMSSCLQSQDLFKNFFPLGT